MKTNKARFNFISPEKETNNPVSWLNKIRRTFRSWYGYLPVEILTTDKILVSEIEAIERIMMGSMEFKK